jgi:WhiB family redox-sensing transcriptional regulator
MTEYASAGWRAAGACVTADPELFFPISPGGGSARQIAQARRICAGCQVRHQCLESALRTNETEGIWGGTTPQERAQARRDEIARRKRERRLLAATAA